MENPALQPVEQGWDFSGLSLCLLYLVVPFLWSETEAVLMQGDVRGKHPSFPCALAWTRGRYTRKMEE